jgi:hypothetical protein
LYFELNKTKKRYESINAYAARCGNSIKAFTFERKELGEKKSK